MLFRSLCGLLAALRGAAAEQGKGNRKKGEREHFGEKVEKGGSARDRKYLLDLTDEIEIEEKSKQARACDFSIEEEGIEEVEKEAEVRLLELSSNWQSVTLDALSKYIQFKNQIEINDNNNSHTDSSNNKNNDNNNDNNNNNNNNNNHNNNNDNDNNDNNISDNDNDNNRDEINNDGKGIHHDKNKNKLFGIDCHNYDIGGNDLLIGNEILSPLSALKFLRVSCPSEESGTLFESLANNISKNIPHANKKIGLKDVAIAKNNLKSSNLNDAPMEIKINVTSGSVIDNYLNSRESSGVPPFCAENLSSLKKKKKGRKNVSSLKQFSTSSTTSKNIPLSLPLSPSVLESNHEYGPFSVILCDLIEGSGLIRQGALQEIKFALDFLCKDEKDDTGQRARTVPYSVSVVCAVIESKDLWNNHRVDSSNMDEVSSAINNLICRKNGNYPLFF